MLAGAAIIVVLLSCALHVIVFIALFIRLPFITRSADLEALSRVLSQPRNMRLLIIVLINALVLSGAAGLYAYLDNTSDTSRRERAVPGSSAARTTP